MDQLADRYGDDVVIVEWDLDRQMTSQSPRRGMWFRARGATSATTPMILVDSGYAITEGHHQDFDRVYSRLIEEARAVPPLVTIEAFYEVEGSNVQIQGRFRNDHSQPLVYDDNVQLHALIYEEKHSVHTGRIVQASKTVPVLDDVEPGAWADFEIEVDGAAGLNWSRSHVVVIADFRPNNQQAYMALNSTLAIEGAPTPTVEPTATPVPATNTPQPTLPPFPTNTPQPDPSEPPEDTPSTVFLPDLRNEQ